MKYCFKLILTLFLFSNISFSQFYAEEEISPNIIEFMKIADETAKYFDENKGLQKKFNDEELEQIAKLYFKCYNKNPVGFYNYLEQEHIKWKQRVLESDKKSEELRPWLKIYYLRDQIAEKYGIAFTEVIGTPSFLRCKFLHTNRSSYFSPDTKLNHPQINFIFLIEDILKGDKFFNVGDTVTVSTIPDVESPSPTFEMENSYLIPIRLWIGLTKYKGEVTFNYLHEYYDRWVMGKPPKTFPIENEMIKECEYFGINDTSWVDFKKFFKEKYLIFD